MCNIRTIRNILQASLQFTTFSPYDQRETLFFSANPPLHEFDLQRYESSDATTVEADMDVDKDKEGDDDDEDDEDDRSGFTHLLLFGTINILCHLPSVILLR